MLFNNCIHSIHPVPFGDMDTPAPAPPQRRDYNVYVPEFNVCDKVRFVWQGDGPPAKYSM